jgi:SNF2 family DNA or RNA helicase
MLDTELNPVSLSYGNSFKYEINIGSFVFNIITKTLQAQKDRKYITFKGGALIDEVGLGKTIQSITLCLLNPAPVCNMTYIDTEHNMLKSRATLIICPNQLCGQWGREFKKMINEPNCKVVPLLTKTHFTDLTYLDLLDADFVIVSFNFIGNANFTKKYTSRISTSKSYHKSKNWNHITVQNLFRDLSNELITDPTSLFKNQPLFPLIYWHRIMIDEFHEIYTVPKYIYVKRIVPLLKSTYKWVITGTPFDKGSECFYEMLNFSVDYKHNMKENIIQIENINKHMLKNYFRRNTKKSVEEEVKLPELREKIIWLKFSHTERMMYNAYLTDATIDRRSAIIRQICCHPKLADEIKGVLSKCKTLEDIENSMVEHYRNQYENSMINVKRYEIRIAKTERRILITNYKIQRRFLKQIGYQVKIELPPFEYDDFKGMDIENKDSDDSDNDNNDDDMNISDNDEEIADKPLMVINQENQTIIENKIGNLLANNVSRTLIKYNEILNKQKEKHILATNVCNGKRSSYEFFNNMLERIKKFTDKSKLKFERKLEKNRRRDVEGSDYESSSEDLSEDSSDYSSDSDNEEDLCGICLCEISGDDVGVTKCGHIFDYECLRVHINTNNRCPICSTHNNKSDISLISFERPSYTQDNIELLQNKIELINKVGTKLTNLIYYLNSIDEHVIIFSQWDSLLKKVGEVLTEHGINNVFCRGNIWTRDKAIREFTENNNIKVIMLSSESAASGTNLTKATKVILLDPVSGTYAHRRNTEWQAVGRAYRLGQTKSVEIVRFIIRDTVEEEIYRENKSEDIKQNTQLVISETTDETITLNDAKLQSITVAVINAKEKRQQKIKERQTRRQRKLEKVSNKYKKKVVRQKTRN